jgi:alkanesulfonate monooxygenase SsuD/methylene tetrahydromethanopterin reductase-like flavin-dependent oxidoreductase (luciferase family)
MRTTWTADPVTFQGRYYSVRDVHALPKPAQAGGIPIWIGGHTDAAVRRAGELGDAWHPIGLRPPALLFPEEYAAKVKTLQAAARAAGRDPDSITLTLRVPMEVRSKRAKAPAGDRPRFQGTADEVLADIRAYAELGVSHFVFDPTVQEIDAVLANLERFAHDVRPRLDVRRRPARRVRPPAHASRPARKRRR